MKARVWAVATLAVALLLAGSIYLVRERRAEFVAAESAATGVERLTPDALARTKRFASELVVADIVIAASIAAISALVISNRRAVRRYRILFATNQALLGGEDTPDLLNAICCAAVSEGGFVLVWIALTVEHGFLRPEAVAGPALGYAEGLSVCADADEPGGQGPTGVALREGRSVICNDFLHDPLTVRWAERARRFGIRASAALPLSQNGRSIGIIGLYSAERGHFDAAECTLVRHMAEDISLGIEHLRRGAEIERNSAQLRMDITQRKKAQQELQAYAERLRGLSRRLMEVEEAERRNITRELHDRVGQSLAALNLNLGLIRSGMGREQDPDVVGKRLSAAQALLESAITDIRDLMADLQPPALNEYGLFAALTVYVDSLRRTTAVPMTFTGRDIEPPLPPAVAMALFRIAQGALTNAVKHAAARHISVELTASPDRVRLTIADDGRGFEIAGERTTTPTWGLSIMRERAEAIGAMLEIESKPEQGTRIIVELGRGQA
ncbi:MAG TPA: GAF domain-containing sensor histidine kinase [Steroidobacteraceae bacterium]|nr:GAF domain-containing sensor histidine kinase [Steroidobacteraceae bacterium]